VSFRVRRRRMPRQSACGGVPTRDATCWGGDPPHPCAEPVWRLPVHGARCRTLARCPSRRLSALGSAWLTRMTAVSLARCAREPPHSAKQSPCARAGP
jgi:hypothetical protein